MKKIILSLIILLFACSGLFSQKVKVKKDDVLFDGVPILKVSSEGRDYTFTNLNDDTKIVVTLETEGAGDEKEDWLIVKDPVLNRKHKVKMEWYTISVNFKKGISELLSKKYNIITEEGIVNLDAFFDINSTPAQEHEFSSRSREYNSQYYVVENQIVDYKGTVYFTVENEFNPNIAGIKVYDVKDKNNKNFATIFSSDGKQKVITFDNRQKQIELAPDPSKNLVERLYQFLLDHNYHDVFDNGIDERMKIKVSEFEQKKKNSPNILKQKGYIIDKKGVKVEGKVSVIFEYIIDPRSTIIVDDGDNDADFVIVYYLNKKGKEAYTRYPNAEAHIINSDGTETVYRKFKTQDKKTLNSKATLNTLVGGNSAFYKIVYEGDHLTLIHNQLEKEIYGLYKNDEKRAQLLVTNPLRNHNILYDYLNCKLPDEFKNLNYAKETDLLKIIEYYEKSCSK